jgi:hypothetical protein
LKKLLFSCLFLVQSCKKCCKTLLSTKI